LPTGPHEQDKHGILQRRSRADLKALGRRNLTSGDGFALLVENLDPARAEDG
jgi:hypothetical protein